MPITEYMNRIAPDVTAWRRHLHSIPELGFQEHQTSAYIASKLDEWGVPYVRLAGTGLVATLRAGTSPRTIGLRADIDALPMQEANEFEWRSTTPGRMHACGHDGHTAMLLGAVRYLAETRNFDGTVNFIFQPAEEGPGGAKVMIDEGLFEKFPCERVYGAHNDPLMPVGQMSMIVGPAMAAADTFSIRITGRGGHAARPHHTIDPLIAGAHVALALQTIVARRTDPLESAVVSITQFHAGTADNVIAQHAELRGTVRTLKSEVQDATEKLLTEVAQAAAAVAGATAEVSYQRGYPSVMNDADATARAASAAIKLLGAEAVHQDRAPVMGGEDFAYMSRARPGCFVRIGQAGPNRGSVSLHNVRYDFNDDALPVGTAYWATLVEQELAAQA